MSKSHIGIAPFTMARTTAGGYVNILAGDPVPGSVSVDDLKRLVDEGFLAELPDLADVVIEEPLGPPAKAAAKGDWEAYARSQGATDADIDGVTKDDLITLYGDVS